MISFMTEFHVHNRAKTWGINNTVVYERVEQIMEQVNYTPCKLIPKGKNL